ncbi:hypothetical protein KM043_007283 [Ampulex compressa]|nr:hypothetical protein KM043_007283 [Ampulex compressa]
MLESLSARLVIPRAEVCAERQVGAERCVSLRNLFSPTAVGGCREVGNRSSAGQGHTPWVCVDGGTRCPPAPSITDMSRKYADHGGPFDVAKSISSEPVSLRVEDRSGKDEEVEEEGQRDMAGLWRRRDLLRPL